jgi:glutaredoxin
MSRKKYTCPRCGLCTNIKNQFVDHLKRKKPCLPQLADVDTTITLKQLEDEYAAKPFECEHCHKRFAHDSNMYTHKKTCKSFKQDNNLPTCLKCDKRPTYAVSGSTNAVYCCDHKLDGMLYVKNNQCQETGCTKTPSFGSDGEKRALYCAMHKLAGMTDIKNKMCVEEHCMKRASYNAPGEKTASYCAEHKHTGMIHVNGNTCNETNCQKAPIYNISGETKGVYCVEHKSAEMIDVVNKRCQQVGCTKRPQYNVAGATKGIFCSIHKQAGMINVKSKRCQEASCDKTPGYGFPDTKVRIYCSEHKLEGMILITNRRCQETDCSSIAYFNVPGATTVLFCSVHKQAGMINVVAKSCKEEGCHKIPKFDVPGATRGMYCGEHKLVGMIDVVTKRCEECCTPKPQYGPPRKKAVRCKKHKKPGDVRNPNAKCSFVTDSKKCSNYALFGTGDNPTACEDHATMEMRNLVERACVSCGLPEVLNEAGICGVCDPEVVKRVCLAKQKIVSAYMKEKGLVWVSEDKQLADASACDYKKRPDFLFDAGTHFVIVEVDEHQHKGRACECEQVRMVNLTQALQLPTVFIRFNPDEYKPSKGNQVANSVRNDELVRVIKMLIGKSVKEIFEEGSVCGAVYLYYDGDRGSEHTKVRTVT